MTVLHIASITKDKSNGINVVAPKHVFYQSEYANTALLNISNYQYQNSNIKVFNGIEFSSLESPFNKPDLVVFHGLYYPKYIKISKYLSKNNIPYIIFPHGSLSKKAIKSDFFKFIKKALAHLLIFNSFIKKAKAIQFLSKGEQKHSYFSKKGIIIPNGIELPQDYYRPIKNKEGINITFIGRKNKIHKGLDLLIKAANKVKNELLRHKVKINIYGPNRGNADNYINNYIKKHGLDTIVFNHGPVFGQQKEQVLRETDIFVHTSRWEGLPTAVIEAMSYGIPVLVTRGTGIYDDVKKYQCGWAAETNAVSIADKLLLLTKQKSKIIEYGKKAYEAVIELFAWEKVAKDSIALYQSLLKINH
ncbi:MAG TPA: glycosyltransferase family 4 protein [Clostridia bacterium]